MDENLVQNPEENSVTPAEISVAELDSNGLLKKRRKVSLDSRKARAGYMFVMPFILGVVLIYLPILLDSIWFSMSKEVRNPNDIFSVSYEFVGMKYYKEAFSTPAFTTALVSGIQQLIFEVPAVIIFSLFIAVVLNQKMLGRAAFRAIFFLPVIVSTGIMETINIRDNMAQSAQSIDDGTGGGGMEIISALDMQVLFANMKVGGELAVYVVNIVNNVYKIINYSGVQMLIFLAGLQSISPSIYEACKIDGATGWETFWKVTFPMISPMILVNSVYSIIDAFTRTDNTVITHIVEHIERADKYSASAAYWIYFVIIMLIIAAFAAIASTFIFYQRRD